MPIIRSAAVFAVIFISATTFAQQTDSEATATQTPPPATATATTTDPQTPPPATTSEPQTATEPQQPPPPTPTPEPATTTPVPSVLSDAASGAYQRRDSLPAVNIYLPEGQASVRLRKLIRNVLFESQIDYEFVNGDISTFLRYKYYARNYTYRIGVFDSIEFPDIGSSSQKEFERVRGGLLLVGVPKDYNNRWFFLLQDDRLTFGTDRPDNRKNNIYTKIGYQYGTQFDERMNAIVGEQRGRITPVLTAFRDIGPQKTGLAAAITQSGRVATGDYQYTKFEAEGLRRFDLTSTSFVFSRLHLGTYLAREEMIDRDTRCNAFEDGETIVDTDLNNDGEIDDSERFSAWKCYAIPQSELFRLGGREALKSIGSSDNSIGTQELHLTNELFVPVFRNKDYKLGALYWNTLYAIGYVGAGTVGFKTRDLTETSRGVVDVGLGTESAISYRDWDIYLSVLVAYTAAAPEEIGGGTKVRFAIRTVR